MNNLRNFSGSITTGIYYRNSKTNKHSVVCFSWFFSIGNTINWIKIVGSVGNILEKVIHQRLDRVPTIPPVIVPPLITPENSGTTGPMSHHLDGQGMENNGANNIVLFAIAGLTFFIVLKGWGLLFKNDINQNLPNGNVELISDVDKALENVRVLCTERTGFVSIIANIIVCNFEILTVLLTIVSLTALTTVCYLIFININRNKNNSAWNNKDIIDIDVCNPPPNNSYLDRTNVK